MIAAVLRTTARRLIRGVSMMDSGRLVWVDLEVRMLRGVLPISYAFIDRWEVRVTC